MPRLTPIHYKKFEKFLKYIGCVFDRQKGDHLIYERSDLKRPIVFPKDISISPFVIRSNLRTLGISTKEYLDITKSL